MEVLFKEDVNFAEIILYKNYSNIEQKPIPILYEPYPNIRKVKIEPPKKDDGIFSGNDFFEELDSSLKKIICTKSNVHREDPNFRLYPKDRHHIFYADNPKMSFTNYSQSGRPTVFYDPIKLINAKSKNHFFETIKDKHIERHYNNPFAGIKICRVERWIKKDGDKITIKLYIGVRERGVNKIYFTKRTSSVTVTFNLHTGNFNVINYQKLRKSKKKNFYTNSFTSLKQALSQIYDISSKVSTSVISGKIIENFNNDKFHFAVKKSLNFNNDGSLSSWPYQVLVGGIIELWIPKFSELKRIKLPNDSKRLLINFYPTEKYLKKNNRKLIAAILDRFGIKSNITIKILHINTDLNMLSLVELCRLFGKNYQKYIGNVDMKFFERKPNNHNDIQVKYSLMEKLENGNNVYLYEIKNTDRENIVKIVNDYMKNHVQYESGDSALISMFHDHFRMLRGVIDFYPELQLRSRTYESFRMEHVDLSRIEQSIKTGFSIEYIFDKRMIEAIEEPISITELNDLPIMYFDSQREAREYEKEYCNLPVSATQRVFIPKILRTSEDYLEEGLYMHHCVGGYIDQERSIIISLRLDKERVTCEFDARTRKCLQMRYFTNQNPPEYYRAALNELENRVLIYSGKFGSIEKIKKQLEINGKKIPIHEEF